MIASAYVVTVRVEQPAMRWLRDVKPQLDAAWLALAARR